MQKNSPQIMPPESCISSNRSKIFLTAAIMISFFVVLILTYFPAIKINYLYMEDYIYFKLGSEQLYNDSLVNEIKGNTMNGKSVYGIFLNVMAKSFQKANTVRLLGIISLGLLAFIIYTFLKRYGIRSDHSFLIGIIICMFPGFQIYILWTVCVPYIYSAILSITAGLLFFKFVPKKNTEWPIQAALLSSIISLMVIAMHIYPPAAMLYWAAGIIPLSVLKNEDFTKRWYKPFIIHIFIGLASTAVYFFSVKVLQFLFNIGFPSRGELLSLSKIPIKLKWFFYCPLNYALNLWNIFPTYKMATIVGIIIIALFLMNITRITKGKKRINLLWNHCLRLLLISFILLLCYLPNLTVTSTEPVYRTLVSLTVAVCLLSYFGLVNILEFMTFIPGFSANLRDKTITLTLALLAIIAIYNTHNNVNNFALLQAKDYKYIKSAISKLITSETSEISEIYFRRFNRNKIVKSGFLYDEFGLPTSAHPWGPRHVVRLALHDLGLTMNIKLSEGAFDKPIPIDEHIFTVDMTKVDFLSGYKSSITNPQKYCLTFPKRL